MRSAARTCESTHLGGRRFVKVLVVAGAMCALTGCDPAGVPEHADGVSLELVVSRDGRAVLHLDRPWFRRDWRGRFGQLMTSKSMYLGAADLRSLFLL